MSSEMKWLYFVVAFLSILIVLTYIAGTSIGKRYARTDELGVPFAITVDSTSSVTVRERDSKDQVRVDVEKVASVVREVTDGLSSWADVLKMYPLHSSETAEE